MKKTLLTIGRWVLTLVWFMVVHPLVWVIQGLITPIEIVYNLIIFKGDFSPREYWYYFGSKVSDAYEEWEYAFDEDEEDEFEEA